MIKQYIKQALRMIGENKLLSVISILGTALAICMIMVIVILYVVNTASFKPEVNRGRTCKEAPSARRLSRAVSATP